MTDDLAILEIYIQRCSNCRVRPVQGRPHGSSGPESTPTRLHPHHGTRLRNSGLQFPSWHWAWLGAMSRGAGLILIARLEGHNER